MQEVTAAELYQEAIASNHSTDHLTADVISEIIHEDGIESGDKMWLSGGNTITPEEFCRVYGHDESGAGTPASTHLSRTVANLLRPLVKGEIQSLIVEGSRPMNEFLDSE